MSTKEFVYNLTTWQEVYLLICVFIVLELRVYTSCPIGDIVSTSNRSRFGVDHIVDSSIRPLKKAVSVLDNRFLTDKLKVNIHAIDHQILPINYPSCCY